MHASRLWKDVLPLALEIVKLYMFNLATFWKTLDWDSLLNGRGDRGEALMATSSIKVNDKKNPLCSRTWTLENALLASARNTALT